MILAKALKAHAGKDACFYRDDRIHVAHAIQIKIGH